jgi:hypothetical protein
MATATTTRYAHSDITHVEVLVVAKDIKVVDHEGRRRCLQLGGAYVYLDTDGVTALLERLLLEPEASERVELLDEMSSRVDMLRYHADLAKAV